MSMTQLKNRNATKKLKYITFFLADEEYGIEINKVREIIGIMDITSVPNTPDYIKGVLNLRGKIIPVIDLRLKFGMDFSQYGDRTSIIVIEINISNKMTLIGAIVDTVSEVLQIEDSDIEETPYFGININTAFILGMAKVKDKVKILLDIDKVLTTEEIHLLAQIESAEDDPEKPE